MFFALDCCDFMIYSQSHSSAVRLLTTDPSPRIFGFHFNLDGETRFDGDSGSLDSMARPGD